jgi:hypothetical protein
LLRLDRDRDDHVAPLGHDANRRYFIAAGERGHDLFASRRPSVRSAIYSFARSSLREFPITETELKLIAAAAIMGLNSNPKKG